MIHAQRVNQSVGELFNNSAHCFDEDYSTNPDKIERYRIWTSHIEKYSRSVNANNCLDIGCGSGVLSLFTAQLGLEVTGIDLADEMLKICESKKKKLQIKNVQFTKGNLEEIGEKQFSNFDLIICSSVLEYVNNIDLALESIFNILSDNGFALISLPNRSSIFRRYFNLSFRISGRPEYLGYVKHSYSIKGATEMILNQGFEIAEAVFYGQEPFRLASLMRTVCNERFFTNMMLFVLKKPKGSL